MSDTTAPANTLPTKTEVRKVVGKGKFTVSDAVAGFGVTAPTARKRLSALVEAGIVEVLPETRKNTDEDGNALRGRPATLYKVTTGR